MPNIEDYTVEDFDNDILEALKAHSGENRKEGRKLPPAVERLMAKSKIAANKLRGG